ncbi:MAG: 30S ribosomal protein S4 [Planctomycetes bacterium]|nr:30S ribosomal protein S4 [Planctomycetota bacterium]
MGRYTGPKCRRCRREGHSVCGCKKCALTRRDRPPGMVRWQTKKPSEYAFRLREKQKVKRIYGLLERQFRRFFSMAERAKGNTGENLLVLLERRLDNVLYRAGFGTTRPFARQLVAHGHVTVNGRKVDVASYLVRPGDLVQARREKAVQLFKANHEDTKARNAPSWLEVDGEGAKLKVIGLPKRQEIEDPISEQLIVEIASR